jgi:hypothetical protein
VQKLERPDKSKPSSVQSDRHNEKAVRQVQDARTAQKRG